MHTEHWGWTAWIALIIIESVSGNRSYPTLRFIATPKDVIVNETSNVVLPCNATIGQVTFSWLLNGSLISLESNKYSLANGHDLVVMDVRRHQDNGFYRCKATNKFGSILSNEAFIQVAYFDILENRIPRLIKMNPWESKQFSAPVVDSFPPAKVVWRNKKDVVLHDGFSGNYISSDGDLLIVGAGSSDVYTCTVENLITKQACTKVYRVQVSGSPAGRRDINTMKAPRNQTIREGVYSAMFECIISLAIIVENETKTPKPPQITWYFENKAIDVKNSLKYDYIGNGTSLTMKLIVHNPEPKDTGIIKCRAKGVTKVITHEAILQVLKAKVPRPTCTAQLKPSVMNFYPGDGTEIPCIEDDRDADDTKCEWYKNAVPIVTNNDTRVQVQDGNLLINSINKSDTGLYQVALRNEGGVCITEMPLYINVQDVVPSSRITSPSMTRISSYSSVSTLLLASTTFVEPTTQSTLLLIKATSITPTTTNTMHPSTFISLSTPTPTLTPSRNTSNDNNETATETLWSTTGENFGTTQPTTELSTVHNPKRSANNFKIDLIIWIGSGCGGFIVLVTVVIVTVCCCFKKKRERKRSFVVNSEGLDKLEMCSVKRNGKSPEGQIAEKKGCPGNHSGVDTKHLLNDEEDTMYAPVLALENSVVTLENNVLLWETITQGNQRPLSAHVYEEPITKTQRKPYNKPLPTIPREDKSKPRVTSTHSYLELLGPEQCVEESSHTLSNEKTEGDPEQPLYDCAREGVFTNTLRRLTSQPQQNPSQSPVYHVLEGQQTSASCSNRESILYASPEDILPGSTVQEPLYHVLEPSRPESLYQPLVDYNCEAACKEPTDIYQPLDKKARSTSAPSSTVLNHRIKPKRPSTTYQVGENSRSNPEYDQEGESEYCVYNDEDLYQPLNNTDRCPLNVSKPKNSGSLSRCPEQEFERRGSIPIAIGQPEDSSIQDYEEPTLHAIAVSPKGSLKKENSTKKSTRGHRRNLSDTHTIVNISRLTQRRASAGETLGLRRDQEIPRLQRRNHSDAGLCPIDLSLLRVSIDFESENPRKPIESLYMSLVKPNHVINDENLYSTVQEGERSKDRGSLSL